MASYRNRKPGPRRVTYVVRTMIAMPALEGV